MSQLLPIKDNIINLKKCIYNKNIAEIIENGQNFLLILKSVISNISNCLHGQRSGKHKKKEVKIIKIK